MIGISPGVTVILASFGLLFIIFAVWAVYTQLLPSLRHPRSKPVITIPHSSKFADPKHHRVELRRSLYSNSTPISGSLFRESRNNISDYDLRNSRYSTHALDFSRPPSPDSQRLRRASQSRSRSRSRHQAQSLSELRTSLYSESGLLLHADARSSFVNLVIDQPDVIANVPARPKSQHYDRPRSSRHRQRQNRRSAPWINDSWDTLPTSIFGDTQGPNNSSSIDLASSPSVPAVPQASWPYKHANLSAPNFSRSSRHSLPDYATITPPPSDAKRSPTVNDTDAPGGPGRMSRSMTTTMTPVDQTVPEWPLPTPRIDRIGSAVSLPWVAVEKVYEGKIRAGRTLVKMDHADPADASLKVTAATPLVAAVEVSQIDVV